jgi:S1-C subfamily serine protease
MRILAPALCVFAALSLPSEGAAQPTSELGAPRPSTPARAGEIELQYSDVDRSTVRVFSLRHVDLTRLQGKRLMRDVAEPVAGHGSGFFVGERGLVVTAEHVVRGRSHVAVHAFGESDPRPAKVVYVDAKADLAILQTLGPPRAPIAIPPEPPPLRVRDRVHAVGYPIDAARMDPQSSDGIVAGVLPDGRLQLSISVNPGNSGGPLVDAEERLIGMIIARGNVERGVHGIGVAVTLPKIVEAIALV